MKQNSFVALLLSLTIHAILLMLVLWEFRSDKFYNPPHMGRSDGERVSLKHFRFSQGGEISDKENSGANAQGSVREQTPPQEKSESALTQEAPKTQKQSQKPKTPTLKSTNQKPKSQPKRVPQSTPKSGSESLVQSLARPPKSMQNAPQMPSIYDFGKDMSNQDIKDLYGEEFGSLDAEQRKFIKDNLSGIGRVTQRYLKYPQIAGKMGQQGDNIVEFYLHPNGDISDLKLLTPSGFRLLDENSMHTIRIAYKDYPYPSVKTKIRIRVMYRVY